MKQISKKILIMALLVIALPIVAVAAHAQAADIPDPISYMQIYSAGGTYTSARITVTGTGAVAADRVCGGNLVGHNLVITVKLYANRPHKITCDHLDSHNYKIEFKKGSQSAYHSLPNSSPGADFASVNPPDNTSAPYKACAVIEPQFPPNIINDRCPANAYEIVPKDTPALGIALSSTTNVSAVNGPKATIYLTDANPWDGIPGVSRPFCKGKIDVQYQRTDVVGQPLSITYPKSMSYKNGSCQAKITPDHYTFYHKAKYRLMVSYSAVGNRFLNPPTPVTSAEFTTK